MDVYYRDGCSMAIQLVDTIHDRGKEYMLSFVLSHFVVPPTSKRVLSVGDGIASDSIRLARVGLEVSYVDLS